MRPSDALAAICKLIGGGRCEFREENINKLPMDGQLAKLPMDGQLAIAKAAALVHVRCSWPHTGGALTGRDRCGALSAANRGRAASTCILRLYLKNNQQIERVFDKTQ